MAGPPGPSSEKLLELGGGDSACGKIYEATRAKTMNARLCRPVYYLCEMRKSTSRTKSRSKTRDVQIPVSVKELRGRRYRGGGAMGWKGLLCRLTPKTTSNVQKSRLRRCGRCIWEADERIDPEICSTPERAVLAISNFRLVSCGPSHTNVSEFPYSLSLRRPAGFKIAPNPRHAAQIGSGRWNARDHVSFPLIQRG